MATVPPAKRVKLEFSAQEQVFNHIIQQIIVIHNSFNDKVKQLESKIDGFVTTIKEVLSENLPSEKRQNHCCEEVLERISGIEQFIQSIFDDRRNQSVETGSEAPVVLLPNYKPPTSHSSTEGDSTIQVITLNSESDYPNGCWLGNEKNPEARVRVPITPSQLLHINTLCTTPEKMATVLLDHLFPQEVQATSNLSGKGKHFKKQLDPLKVYGIKAHLMHKFGITERDWYRIKQNLDSKCRTAWRKKTMGLPLSKNKANREEPSEKMLRSNSIILKELSFISDDNSQELPSMIVEDTDCLTLAGGCCEQTLTIITDAGDTVNVPILSAEDDLSDEHSSADDMEEENQDNRNNQNLDQQPEPDRAWAWANQVEPRPSQRIAGEREGSHIYTDGLGFYYHADKVRENRRHLRCTEHHKTGCRARASMSVEENSPIIPSRSSPKHNHLPDGQRGTKLRKSKKRARKERVAEVSTKHADESTKNLEAAVETSRIQATRAMASSVLMEEENQDNHNDLVEAVENDSGEAAYAVDQNLQFQNLDQQTGPPNQDEPRSSQRMPGEREGSQVYTDGLGFYYHTDKVRGNRRYLRCTECHKTGCRARASTSVKENSIITPSRSSPIHNHLPDRQRGTKLTFLCTLKKRAREERGAKISTIYDNEATRNPKAAIETSRMHAMRVMARQKKIRASNPDSVMYE